MSWSNEETGDAPSGAGPARPGSRPEHAGVAEQLVDLMVYLPIGVATSVVEDLPGFAARGRSAVQERIRTARGIGEVTVVLGRRSLASRLRAPEAAGDGPGAGPAPAASATGAARHAPQRRPSRPQSATTAQPAPEETVEVETDVEAIIAGYDTLPASQVVRRLDSLSPTELAEIGRYEAAGRGRRTILHRVRQIQSAPPEPPADRSG